MLVLAILLLLVAAGSVGAAILTGEFDLAWVSVGASALAALLLPLRRWRLRRRRAAGKRGDSPRPGAPDQLEGGATSDEAPDERTAEDTGTAPSSSQETTGLEDTGSGDGSDDGEPAEEDTDAADLLMVWDLADEVVVVDEHPRYHLESCRWPGSAETERLSVSEARELGFTPCARCCPDAALARKFRAEHLSQDSTA